MTATRAGRRAVALTAVVVGVTEMLLSSLDLASEAAAHEAAHDRAALGPLPVHPHPGPLRHEFAHHLGHGFETRYALYVAGIVLVVAARGLWFGKRTAWRIAVAITVAIAAGTTLSAIRNAAGPTTATTIIGVAFLGVLLASRGWFRVRSDPGLARTGVQTLAVGTAAVFAYGVIGINALDDHLRHSPSALESVGATLRLLFLVPSSVETTTHFGAGFVASVRGAMVFVIFLSVLRLVAGVLHDQAPTAERTVRRLLADFGTGTLDHFVLLDDKRWLIGSDGDAFVAYKVLGTTAVALGGPIGAVDSRPVVLREFIDLCEANGWTYAFHQVRPEDLPMFDEVGGLTALKIGEEAIVPVATWSLTDPGRKQVRSAIRRVERAGYEVVDLPAPVDDATLRQLRTVSDAWMADGGHRERTFTVGRFDDDDLRTEDIAVVRHVETGDIVAFANILPSYQSPVGNIDLMRRNPDAPNGVMEALFVHLFARFRDEGRTGMTLGLAPFANVTGDAVGERALRVLYERGEDAFHYQGLRRFKDKWDPEWEDRYLLYRTDADLPKVAVAVTRAGEIPEPRPVLRTLQNLGRRFPVTLAINGTILLLMTVTQIAPKIDPGLLRDFGLDWGDLTHLQWWRLPTSQMLETRPGLIISNIALCLIALPIAERRLGSRIAAAVFFLGDWVSTIPVWIGLRVAASNSTWAAAQLHLRDAGPSCGAWALAIAAATTFDRPVVRRTLLGLMLGFLVSQFVFYDRLFDTQHLISAGVTCIVFTGIRYRRDHPEEASPSAAQAGRTG